jgi:hypothetical protein
MPCLVLCWFLQVFAPASEPHLLLLADSVIRASDAAATGAEPGVPEDSSEWRVQQLVRVSLVYPAHQLCSCFVHRHTSSASMTVCSTDGQQPLLQAEPAWRVQFVCSHVGSSNGIQHSSRLKCSP